ncbi:hypothetical protein [Streptomyces boncukensis]|uniref:Uncharacterized protein n=1 Tax=Streptomyces boncukensis TaxID=2711219 RepID=A0A6G4X8Q1_9ACTN|nr:hypothetical protein [Streptomyces boncukensis]NGO73532.1 hypothetical protein [Streptomyces boncukensis]
MEHPNEKFRDQIKEHLKSDEPPDARAENALRLIAEELRSEVHAEQLQPEEGQGQDAFSVVDSWASLVSFAVGSVYAPQSPFPRPGWSRGVSEMLSHIVELLSQCLKRLRGLSAPTSWAIVVTFPWGLSLEVSWSLER